MFSSIMQPFPKITTFFFTLSKISSKKETKKSKIRKSSSLEGFQLSKVSEGGKNNNNNNLKNLKDPELCTYFGFI